MSTTLRTILVVLIAGLVLSGCASASGSTAPASIQVEGAWVRAMIMGAAQPTAMMGEAMPGTMSEAMSGANSAAYMLLRNPGAQADRLIGAESDAAAQVEIHLAEMKDGVMSMHPVDGVDVPAGGSLELKPGSYHIMLLGLTRDLAAGDTLQLTLIFEQAGRVAVTAEIRE